MDDYVMDNPEPTPDEFVDMPEPENKIYARPDQTGHVVRFFSSVFELPEPGDVLVEEGHEDYHAHAHLKYQLADEDGRYNYRITDDFRLELIPDEDKPGIPASPGPMPTPTELALMEAVAEVYEMITGGGGNG
jgi:hypothetical protein